MLYLRARMITKLLILFDKKKSFLINRIHCIEKNIPPYRRVRSLEKEIRIQESGSESGKV